MLRSSMTTGNVSSNINVNSNMQMALSTDSQAPISSIKKSREELAKEILAKANIDGLLDKARQYVPVSRQASPTNVPVLSEYSASSVCQTKKKIVVDVNKCGLGNRMVSLVSTIMMALIMDRSVDLNWVSNRYCAASYSDMFHSKSQNALPHNFRPFVYNLDEMYPLMQEKVENVCQIYLDQSLNYTHLSLLS